MLGLLWCPDMSAMCPDINFFIRKRKTLKVEARGDAGKGKPVGCCGCLVVSKKGGKDHCVSTLLVFFVCFPRVLLSSAGFGSGASHHMLVFLGRGALLLSEVGLRGRSYKQRTSCTSCCHCKSLLRLMALQCLFAKSIGRFIANSIVVRYS